MSWNQANLERQSYLQNCQSNLAQIGVKVKIVNGTDATVALWKTGSYDLQLYAGYPAVYDPDGLSLPLGCASIGTKGVTSQPTTYLYGGSNNSNWCNPQFDQIMAQARQSGDQSVRAPLYHQASLIFNQQVPVLIDYVPPISYGWSSKLTGVGLYGDPSLVFQNIDQWVKTP
jgi:ABC-type transport system substrate-binding protein